MIIKRGCGFKQCQVGTPGQDYETAENYVDIERYIKYIDTTQFYQYLFIPLLINNELSEIVYSFIRHFE